MHRTQLALVALLALASSGHAQTSANFDLSIVPETEVCAQVKHVKEQRCFLTEALNRWWSKGSTKNRKARRATEEMQAERAALGWARAHYAGDKYRVRITHVEETRGRAGKARPREITMAIQERAGSWMKRVQVVATPKKDAWDVRAR